MINIPLTDTELICKYLYDHNLPLAPYLSGDKTLDAFTAEQMAQFRSALPVSYAGPRAMYDEDIPIPPGHDLVILRGGRFLATHEHAHEYIEFVYLLQGENDEFVDGNEYHMKPGDLVLLAPGTRHRSSSFSDDVLIYYIMVRKSTFENAFLSLLARHDALSVFFSDIVFKGGVGRHVLFHTKENQAIQQIVLSMSNSADYDNEIASRRYNLLFELLCLEVIQHHLTDIHTKDTRQSDLDIVSVLRYLNDNLTDVTVENASAHFGYSRGHMERLIKANTGDTFRGFITRVKMHYAETLLANPKLTIHEITEATGFRDDSSFYRAFKRHFGMTPAEYRKTSDQPVLA